MSLESAGRSRWRRRRSGGRSAGGGVSRGGHVVGRGRGRGGGVRTGEGGGGRGDRGGGSGGRDRGGVEGGLGGGDGGGRRGRSRGDVVFWDGGGLAANDKTEQREKSLITSFNDLKNPQNFHFKTNFLFRKVTFQQQLWLIFLHKKKRKKNSKLVVEPTRAQPGTP